MSYRERAADGAAERAEAEIGRSLSLRATARRGRTFSVYVLAIVVAACSGDGSRGGGSDAGSGDGSVLVWPETGPRPDDTGSGPIDGGDGSGDDADATSTGDAGSDAGRLFGDAGLDPRNPDNGRLDFDCDGLSDAYEFSTVYPDGLKTDPADPDSDGDGILDGIEIGRTAAVETSGCPELADADPTTVTLPTSVDTDGDGIGDGLEDANRNGAIDGLELNPRSPDSDGDGLPDALEDRDLNGQRAPTETHGALRDTDGDGIADGVEDRNRDGTRQADESDPLEVDTDLDGLDDGDEDTNANGLPEVYETIAYDPDTDCDGVSDGDEVNRYMTSPLVPDSDGDGLSDGVELGVTSGVPGARCMMPVAVDADPTTTTDPLDVDTDADGVLDGAEDTNLDGRFTSGELDPLDVDTDGDTVSDGDEIRAGFDPLDPNDPPTGTTPGLTAICADNNLKVVDFDSNTTWTLATERSMTYAPVTVTAMGSNVGVAALDGSNGVAGFVLRMPLLGGAGVTSAAQIGALFGRATAGASSFNLSWTVRLSGRNIISHDGYEASVSNIVEVDVTSGSPPNAAVLRNRLVALLTGLAPADFTGLPTTTGATSTSFVLNLELLVRTQPQEALLVGAVLPASDYDDTADNRSIELNDLTNGTALAEAGARRDKDCDPVLSSGPPEADLLWMADVSPSTDDDRGNIASAASTIVNALSANNVDFRLGVVRHPENERRLGANNGGTLFGTGFIRDPATFDTYMRDNSGDPDGCEFGLTAVRDAIDRALPRTAPGATENARRFRGAAAIAVVYISDEYAQELTMLTAQDCFGYNPACNTGIGDYYEEGEENTVCQVQLSTAQQSCVDSIVQPFINQLRAPQVDGLAFAQVIPSAASPTLCSGYACPARPPPAPPPAPANEPGLGYTEVVNATRGAFYTPCNPNPGRALTAIVDAISGAASPFELTGSPISSTIRVGVVRLGGGGSGQVDVIDRDKDNGFDYDPAANTVFFRGVTASPRPNDLVVISYRNWLPPTSPCPPCTQGTECDPALGICVCSQAVCNACGPNEVCDSDCNCVCGPDCNGQCGGNTVCNSATCQCECPADCGGACAPGEVCNPTTCACECGADCSGACAGTNLECNTDACNCQCNDCGGRCTGIFECNPSTCDCRCDPTCENRCQNNEVCNPDNDCACECPVDCGGCPDNTVCNSTSCACECAPDCDSGCQNNEVCDPGSGCNCVCPADCGGCGPNETCDAADCRCVPAL